MDLNSNNFFPEKKNFFFTPNLIFLMNLEIISGKYERNKFSEDLEIMLFFFFLMFSMKMK